MHLPCRECGRLLDSGVARLGTIQVGSFESGLGELAECLVEFRKKRPGLVRVIERGNPHDGIGIVDPNRLHVEELDFLTLVDDWRPVQDVVVPLELETVSGVDARKTYPPELVGVTDHANHDGTYGPWTVT